MKPSFERASGHTWYIGANLDEPEYEGKCYGCQHLMALPSDIFGASYNCAVKHSSSGNVPEVENCQQWLKCVQSDLSQKGYNDLIESLKNPSN